jgi:hypothetical protein
MYLIVLQIYRNSYCLALRHVFASKYPLRLQVNIATHSWNKGIYDVKALPHNRVTYTNISQKSDIALNVKLNISRITIQLHTTESAHGSTV